MLNYWNGRNNSQLTLTRQLGPRLLARYPSQQNCTAPDCGWDEFTQSAKKTGCPVCHGKGRIAGWTDYYFRARVKWNAAVQLAFAQPTSGIEMGDLTLTVSPYDKELMERVLNLDDAYIEVDGKQIRPSAIQRLDVPTVGEEYQVVCHLYNPGED
ncbi:MAG: hypothetical protein HY868_25525 [Chloroflexi bacterium]|nr:hypothetical protein [Chloroflexota bacterium]